MAQFAITVEVVTKLTAIIDAESQQEAEQILETLRHDDPRITSNRRSKDVQAMILVPVKRKALVADTLPLKEIIDEFE